MKDTELLLLAGGAAVLFLLMRNRTAGGTVARPMVASSAPYKTPINAQQAQTIGAGLGGLMGGLLGSWSNSGGATVARSATTDDAVFSDGGSVFGGVGAGYSWDGNSVPMIDGGDGTIGSYTDSVFA